MKNTIIMVGIIALIIILVVYLFRDSDFVRKLPKHRENFKDNVKDKRSALNRQVKITNAPVITVHDGAVKTEYKMDKKSIYIGSSSRADIVIKDPTVEKLHARIDKRMDDNRIEYEFINLSKCNPCENLNTEARCYEYIGYKRGLIMAEKESFYIGETKVTFEYHTNKHSIGVKKATEEPKEAAKKTVPYRRDRSEGDVHKSTRIVTAQECDYLDESI